MGLWSDKKKNEAISVFAATKSPSLTSEQTNVPLTTIKKWQQQQWWKDKLKDIQEEDYDKLDSRLTKILDKTLDQLADRIEHGEYIFDN